MPHDGTAPALPVTNSDDDLAYRRDLQDASSIIDRLVAALERVVDAPTHAEARAVAAEAIAEFYGR